MTANKIRTVIVDDEPLAREGLSIILEEFDSIEVVAEAVNGNDAIQKISELKPDLVFLDVEMPDLTGFEVLANLTLPENPAIVFVTAYDQYAVQAFEIHAIDYLLKPIDRKLAKRAVGRVVEKENSPKSVDQFEKLQEAVRQIQRRDSDNKNGKLRIKTDGQTLFLKMDTVPLIEANGDYVTIYSGENTYLVYDKLKRMEEALKSDGFVRIHRSYLINTSAIESITNTAFGEFEIRLEGSPKKVRSSRSYHKTVQTLADPI